MSQTQLQADEFNHYLGKQMTRNVDPVLYSTPTTVKREPVIKKDTNDGQQVERDDIF